MSSPAVFAGGDIAAVNGRPIRDWRKVRRSSRDGAASSALVSRSRAMPAGGRRSKPSPRSFSAGVARFRSDCISKAIGRGSAASSPGGAPRRRTVERCGSVLPAMFKTPSARSAWRPPCGASRDRAPDHRCGAKERERRSSKTPWRPAGPQSGYRRWSLPAGFLSGSTESQAHTPSRKPLPAGSSRAFCPTRCRSLPVRRRPGRSEARS